MAGAIQGNALNAERAARKQATSASKALATGQKALGGAEAAVLSKTRANVGTLRAATSNALNAIAFAQVADGSLKLIGEKISEIKALAASAAADTFDDSNRTSAQTEITKLLEAITNIVNTTRFGGTQLLDGTGGSASDGKFIFQTAETATDNTELDLSAKFDTATLGIDTISVTSITDAQAALTALDTALTSVSAGSAAVGAFMKSLEATIVANQTSIENLENAAGVMGDADMGEEVTKLTAAEIRQQIAQEVLSRGNRSDQGIMRIFS
jgi:flagellin